MRPGSGFFDSGTSSQTAAAPAAVNGTFSRNTEPHQKWAEQQAADDGADRHARCQPPWLQMPMASRPLCQGRTRCVMIDSVCGMTAAARQAHRRPRPDQLIRVSARTR